MNLFKTTLATAVLGLACAGGTADAAEMLNQAGYGLGYGNMGNGTGFGYGGLGYGAGTRGYAGPMFANYGGYGWGGYGAGYAGWGYGPGGRNFGGHHGWNHGGFGGYGGCGTGINTNWDGYCQQCGGGGCGHVKVRRRCRPLGCGAGPYVDPNCCGPVVDGCAPCGHRRCGLFHRHRRSAPCCVDTCCEGGLDGAVGYDASDDVSMPVQGDGEELQAPPAADEKPMPLPPEDDQA